jgi:uncharacterized protein
MALMKRLSFIFMLWFLALPVLAAPPLWKIQGPASVVYLFGTVHLLPPDATWEAPALDQAMAQADRLALEIDLSAPNAEAELGQVLMARGLMMDGRTLDQLVPPPVYEKVVTVAKDVGLPPENIRRFRPWLAGLTLAQALIAKQGFSSDAGVEAALLKRRIDGRPSVVGLETFEQQIDIFARLDDKQAAYFLSQTLEEFSDVPSLARDIVSAWTQGNLEKLAEVLIAQMMETPDLYQSILVARNKEWIPKIETFLAMQGVTVVAVGAGHLVGPDSLIQLLTAEGLKVERVQ